MRAWRLGIPNRPASAHAILGCRPGPETSPPGAARGSESSLAASLCSKPPATALNTAGDVHFARRKHHARPSASWNKARASNWKLWPFRPQWHVLPQGRGPLRALEGLQLGSAGALREPQPAPIGGLHPAPAALAAQAAEAEGACAGRSWLAHCAATAGRHHGPWAATLRVEHARCREEGSKSFAMCFPTF